MNELTAGSARIVSFEDEPLIVVDSDDQVLGYRSKAECHDGDGILHRAFSIFVFNSQGQLLLQRRSPKKRLWPLYWSNSCCSHPRRGESDLDAARRRVEEELAITPSLEYLFKFEYQAPFGESGSEYELCSVYVAKSDEPVVVNVHEVVEWKFVDVAAFEADLAAAPDLYTPWLKLEWPRIRQDHWPKVERL